MTDFQVAISAILMKFLCSHTSTQKQEGLCNCTSIELEGFTNALMELTAPRVSVTNIVPPLEYEGNYYFGEDEQTPPRPTVLKHYRQVALREQRAKRKPTN